MKQIMNDQITAILENAKGNTLDVCYTLYCEYLAEAEDPSEVLQLNLQHGKTIGTADAPSEFIKDELRDEVSKKYYGLLHETVRLIMNENLPVNDFYGKLYDCTFMSPLFPEKKEPRAVLLWLLVDKISEVPYFQAVDLLENSNEEYREAIGRIDPQIRKAIHMLNRHFTSRTEEASQLYRISTEIEDEKDRIVYWSVLFSFFKSDEDDGGKE